MSTDPADPSRAPAAPYREPPRRYDDEISLRELYLIFKRGLPLILGAALLAGVAAAAYLWLRPDVYEAETTVVSSPTTVQLQEEGTLTFEPNNAIPFATYEDLATSRATMEATIELLGDDAAGLESFRELQGAAELEQLTGGSGPNAPLTVAHRIHWADPQLAARYADAWAETTVEQVRSTLLANLEPARENTVATIERREAELAEIEAAWEEFAQTDATSLQLRLEGIEELMTTVDRRLANVDRLVAVSAGRRETLLAQLDGAPAAAALDDATLSLLEGEELLEAPAADRLRQLADEAPQDDGQGVAADVTAVLAAAELQRETVELAGLVQERAHLEQALGDYEAQADDLRSRLAELETRRARIERQRTAAQAALSAVTSIEPVLAFVADLTPGNTRVLNDAQVPASPSGPSTLLVALLAAVAAALAATVFVFLREAVRDPEAAA